ncbi:MAG: chemotaxis protein CheX [Bacillota bacterium]
MSQEEILNILLQNEFITNTIMNPIIDNLEKVIIRNNSFLLINKEEIQKESDERLHLFDVSVLLDIMGSLCGKILVSVEESMMKKIVQKFVINEISEEEIAAYMEDTLSECLNIILGNSLDCFGQQYHVTIGNSPLAITSEHAILKYPNTTAWTCYLHTNEGNILLAYIIPETC